MTNEGCLLDNWKCLALYLIGVQFGGELQHSGHVGEQKIKCQPIKAREIGSL